MATPMPTPVPTPAPTQPPLRATIAPTAAPAVIPTPAPTPAPSNNAGSLLDLARANTVRPEDVAFDESRGVAGRIDSLIAQDSPLMQAAQTRARQRQSALGTLNSSMAIQAGEQALLDTALPIANADAGLFQQQNLANQGARNQALLANAQNQLAAGTRGTELDTQNSQMAAELGQRERLSLAELAERRRAAEQAEATRVALAELDSGTRERLANIEFQSRAQIQGNQNIAGAWDRMMGEITRIQTDPNLEPEARTTNINNLLASFQAYSSFWGRTNNTDVTELLNFQVAPTPTSAPTPAPTPAPGSSPGLDGGGGGPGNDGTGS